MVRPRSLLPALVVAAATLAALPAPVPAQVPVGSYAGRPAQQQAQPQPQQQPQQGAPRSAPGADDDPLAVSIDTLTPSVIPDSGNVTITGMVTNTSDETWTGINVYPLTSTALPMTSIEELDAAAQAPDDLVVGERRTDVSANIPALAPGQVAPYTLRVPRRHLGRSEGVHWLGVHALGQNSAGRDTFADGRARTFVPFVRDDRPRVKTALVLQLRRRIDYTADGRIDQPLRWATDLAPGGRLRNLVDLGAAAGDRPVTWLMDPAVVVAVNALVGGNESRMPPVPEEPAPEPAPEEPTPEELAPEESAPPATPLSPTDAGIGAEATDPTAIAAAATEGQAWLDRLQPALAGKQLLALPYGDVDASAASHLDPDQLAEAHTSSATVMATLGLPGTSAIGSPSGFLNPDAMAGAGPDTTVLLTNAAVDIAAPPVVSADGHEVVLTSSTAVQGGPGPDDPFATVAMRQRILSEAAVRLLSPGREPLVAVLPTEWAPVDVNGFFAGLDVGWLDLSPLSEATDRAPAAVDPAEVAYPAFQEDFELDSVNFAAASQLTKTGRTMQQVLTSNTTVGDAVAHQAFTGTSYWQRPRPSEAVGAANRSRVSIETSLGRITVDGPPSVTLSSDTGQFPATVRNGLDEPVAVRVVAVPSRGLSVEAPEEITLDAGESVRLRLSATTEGVGAHSVRLVVASTDGSPLGSSTALPIRSNQVSEIIWIVIVAGGGLLFGAIAVRLFRRFRRARAEGAEHTAPDPA